MKKIFIVAIGSMALGMAALAQSMPANSPANANSSAQTSPSQTTNMSNPGMNAGTQGGSTTNGNAGEKRLKGCIKSENGSYVLEGKRGKEIALSGSADLASHVGQMVTVRGVWSGGSGASNSSAAASSGSSMGNGMSAAGGPFMVSKLHMESSNCKTDTGMNSPDNSGSSNSNASSNGKPSPVHKSLL